jgi:hypothetical protein
MAKEIIAKINNSNIVENIFVIESKETEQLTLEYINETFGNGLYKIVTNIENQPAVNSIYYPEENKFSIGQPWLNWTFNKTTWEWDPPIPYPSDYNFNKVNYVWNESKQNWDPFINI